MPSPCDDGPSAPARALETKYEPSPESPASRPTIKTVGFPTIASATIKIAGETVSAPADPESTGATLSANLPAGRTTLKAWFTDGNGKDLCGAFFVTVEKQ